MNFKNRKGFRRYLGPKRVSLLFFIGVSISLIWDFFHTGESRLDIVNQYRFEHPITLVCIFLVLYALSVVSFLPSLPLNLAAGFFWGGLLGGVYATIGVTIGGWIAFLLARYFFGQPLAKKFNSRWIQMISAELGNGKWKFLAFIRLNPIIPTGPLNYILGLTSISNFTFLWTTFIFLLPPSIAVSFIGDTLQTFSSESQEVSESIRAILNLSAAITVLALIGFIAKFYNLKMDKNENNTFSNDS